MAARLSGALRDAATSPSEAIEAVKHLLTLQADGARCVADADPLGLYLDAQARRARARVPPLQPRGHKCAQLRCARMPGPGFGRRSRVRADCAHAWARRDSVSADPPVSCRKTARHRSSVGVPARASGAARQRDSAPARAQDQNLHALMDAAAEEHVAALQRLEDTAAAFPPVPSLAADLVRQSYPHPGPAGHPRPLGPGRAGLRAPAWRTPGSARPGPVGAPCWQT